MRDSTLRTRVHAIARDFELDNLTEQNVPRFEEFRERVRAFSNVDRVAYQDDATRDPAAGLLDSPSVLSATAVAPEPQKQLKPQPVVAAPSTTEPATTSTTAAPIAGVTPLTP